MRNLFLIAIAVFASSTSQAQAPTETAASAAVGAPPLSVNAIVPNFYYTDLAAARAWYVNELGLKPIYDDGWVVILEFGPGMQLALVDGERGFLKPVQDKGTMLSIETDDIDGWYARAQRAKGARWLKGREIVVAAPGLNEHKDIYEFRLVDPGGYIVEFYRWKPEFRPQGSR